MESGPRAGLHHFLNFDSRFHPRLDTDRFQNPEAHRTHFLNFTPTDKILFCSLAEPSVGPSELTENKGTFIDLHS